MEDLSQDWDSGSDMATSPSPSISSQASMITSNGTKKAINRGRWTKEEVRKLNFYSDRGIREQPRGFFLETKPEIFLGKDDRYF